MAHCVIYIVEKHIFSTSMYERRQSGGVQAEPDPECRTDNEAWRDFKVTPQRALWMREWGEEKEKGREWGGWELREERKSKASWRQNADSPCDACISSCCPVSKLRRQKNIAVTEALVFLWHMLTKPSFYIVPRSSIVSTNMARTVYLILTSLACAQRFSKKRVINSWHNLWLIQTIWF